MTPIKQTKRDMLADPEWWLIPFMDFVDEFRRDMDMSILQEPLELDNERFDALIASAIEHLCDEMGLDPPAWVEAVPGCKERWFVSGTKHPKLIEIIIQECPPAFRKRNIFVLENFLDRV